MADVYADAADEEPKIRDELGCVEGQLREVIDRYLRAFEAGTMSDTVCAPRVEELSARRSALFEHQHRLLARLQASAPDLPERQELDAISAAVRSAIQDGTPAVVRQLLDALVDIVEITEGKEAFPYFKVPARTETPEPTSARASVTPVRMGSHQVEVEGVEPSSFGFSAGLLRAQPVSESRASRPHRQWREAPVS